MLHRGLCSAAGWECGMSPEEASSLPGPLLGKQRGSAVGRDGPGCCRDIIPTWHRPQGGGAGAPVVAHPACRKMPIQPHGQHRAIEETRGCLRGRHQAPESIWVSFFPCNPSVLNFFGGFHSKFFGFYGKCFAVVGSARLSGCPAQGCLEPEQREGKMPTWQIHQQITHVQPASATRRQWEPLLGAVPVCPSVQQGRTIDFVARDTRWCTSPGPSPCPSVAMCCAPVPSSGTFLPTPGPSGASPARVSLPFLQAAAPGGTSPPCQSSGGRCFHLLLSFVATNYLFCPNFAIMRR